jgi:hypothetical protein
MNSDSESLQHQLLAWILADCAEIGEYPSVQGKDVEGVRNSDEKIAAYKSGAFESGGKPQTFQLGEIPTVQERFQAVLKRRLQAQIQSHPPLFPWESQLAEYPDYVDNQSIALVPAWGWMAQQSKLNLPVTLPEKVFRQLLEKCQGLVSSSLPLGAKLVQVVEDFFPSESHSINDLAGMVLRSNYRSVDALEAVPNLENDFSDLQPRQQMALSLMAAKQLLENLTVPVSPSTPVAFRQWQTSAGTLNLRVEYHSQGTVTKLRVDAELPARGILKLQGNGSQATSQSSSAGCLSLELSCKQINQTYSLEVQFPDIDQQPMLFAINPTM